MIKNDFIHNERGVALIEFAVFVPFLLFLFLGSIEFTRFIIIQEKVERTAYALSEIIDQYLPDGTDGASAESMISVKNITENVFAQFPRIMDPYVDPSNFRTIASSVLKTSAAAPNDIIIKWQIASDKENGNLDSDDTVSIVNNLKADKINPSVKDSTATFNAAILSNLSTMQVGENMIVVEVFYRYNPMFSDFLKTIGAESLTNKAIISRVYSMPRQGSLLTLPPQFK